MSTKQLYNFFWRLSLTLVLVMTLFAGITVQAEPASNPVPLEASRPSTAVLPTIPTPSNPAAFVDDLDNFTKSWDHSTNLTFATTNPEKFGGDTSRLQRTSGTQVEYIIYHSNVVITSLVVETYLNSNSNPQDFTFLVSADNLTYSPLAINKTLLSNPEDATWSSVTYSSQQIPAGIRYIKVIFGNSTNNGDAQISRILLNYLKFVQELDTPHPRLLATSADFARVKNWVSGPNLDPTVKTWYNNIRGSAQALLASPVITYYYPDGVRLLEVSRTVLKRMFQLGLAYQLEGDPAYLERAWSELNAVANFPDWHPDHFLDTAEMTLAVSVGYDWFYQGWTPARREVIRSAIVNLGLQPALKVYRGDKSGNNNRYFWLNVNNNWSIVCNGGIGAGALALGNEIPGLAEELLQNGFSNIQNGLSEYEPNGAYPEGIGYWGYASSYVAYYLSSLQNALGTTYGLDTYNPGIAVTGDFPIYLDGSKYGFNYGDAPPDKTYQAALFWLANKYNKPLYNWYQKQTTGQTVPALLWYNPTLNQAPDNEPLDRYFEGVQVATFRSSWTDPNAIFTGLKAGNNQAGHNDLDLGTFVLDALGQRWAEELGYGDYNSPGYWDSKVSGGRWNYYRKRAEGQNTLVISPTNGPDQNPLADSPITDFIVRPKISYAIANLTSAYSQTTQNVQRGIQLTQNRTQILLQDEIQTNSPADVWWFMHTTAELTLSNSNRTAVFTKTGTTARLWATILTPGASFTVMEAVPLPESPVATQQNNTAWQKLAVKLDNVVTTRLAILFVPLDQGESPPTSVQLPVVTPLAEWYKLGVDYIVTRPDGNNNVTTTGSLAIALANASSGQLIAFAPNITSVIMPSTGPALPALKKGVTLEGRCKSNQPQITLNGNNATVAQGLQLSGNSTVSGLKIFSFRGIQLRATSGGNRLKCMVVQR